MKKSIAMFFFVVFAGIVSHAQEKNPPAPPPPPPKAEIVKYIILPPAEELNRFYAKNPSVSNAYYNENRQLVVELKNGKKELYNLAMKDQYRSFIDKYDGLPPALPPPPPPHLPSKKN